MGDRLKLLREEARPSKKPRGWYFSQNSSFANRRNYSHSMVPGGFDVTSRTTRLTSATSLVIRLEMSQHVIGSLVQSVMASSLTPDAKQWDGRTSDHRLGLPQSGHRREPTDTARSQIKPRLGDFRADDGVRRPQRLRRSLRDLTNDANTQDRAPGRGGGQQSPPASPTHARSLEPHP